MNGGLAYLGVAAWVGLIVIFNVWYEKDKKDD